MLLRLINEVSETLNALEGIPKKAISRREGTLKLTTQHGKTRFYLKTHETARKYLSREKLPEIRILAEKLYSQQYQNTLEREISILRCFKEAMQECGTLDDAYNSLPEPVRNLVKPRKHLNDKAVERWENANRPAQRLGPGEGLRTLHGEYVRSKSEVIIADRLAAFGVPYRYEVPLLLEHRLFHPDFTAYNRRTGRQYRWEHLGKMGDPEYSCDALSRLSLYSRNGIILWQNLLITWETQERPLMTEVVDLIIERYLL